MYRHDFLYADWIMVSAVPSNPSLSILRAHLPEPKLSSPVQYILRNLLGTKTFARHIINDNFEYKCLIIVFANFRVWRSWTESWSMMTKNRFRWTSAYSQTPYSKDFRSTQTFHSNSFWKNYLINSVFWGFHIFLGWGPIEDPMAFYVYVYL